MKQDPNGQWSAMVILCNIQQQTYNSAILGNNGKGQSLVIAVGCHLSIKIWKHIQETIICIATTMWKACTACQSLHPDATRLKICMCMSSACSSNDLCILKRNCSWTLNAQSNTLTQLSSASNKTEYTMTFEIILGNDQNWKEGEDWVTDWPDHWSRPMVSIRPP